MEQTKLNFQPLAPGEPFEPMDSGVTLPPRSASQSTLHSHFPSVHARSAFYGKSGHKSLASSTTSSLASSVNFSTSNENLVSRPFFTPPPLSPKILASPTSALLLQANTSPVGGASPVLESSVNVSHSHNDSASVSPCPSLAAREPSAYGGDSQESFNTLCSSLSTQSLSQAYSFQSYPADTPMEPLSAQFPSTDNSQSCSSFNGSPCSEPSLEAPAQNQPSLAPEAPTASCSSALHGGFNARKLGLGPFRSVQSTLPRDEVEKSRIFTLDVFSVYLRNPRVLLCSPTDRQVKWGRVGGAISARRVLRHRRLEDRRDSVLGGDRSQPSGSSGNHSATSRAAGSPFPSLAAAPGPTRPSRASVSASAFATKPSPERRASVGDLNKELLSRKEYTDPSKASVPKPVQSARGTPLNIPAHAEGFTLLTDSEVQLCSALRLWPDQYLRIKQALITEKEQVGYFRKRDAQKLCRIDVNKTNKIYDWFIALGWLLNKY